VSRITASQDDARIESIYRAAEHRAEALRGGLPAHAKADDLRPIAESSLAREAAIECERHLVRKRFLPAELSSEWAWTILLDVFVNEQHASGTKLSHLASKRGLSELTTARQVAALIEYGLIKRDSETKKIKESQLNTTFIGRKIIYNIMNYLNNII
jgi:hypothetical protein